MYTPGFRLEILDSTVGTVVRKTVKSFHGPRISPKRWQEHWRACMTKAGLVSYQLDPYLCSHAGKRTALAYHVDDVLIVGTRHSIQDVLAEPSSDLDIVATDVTKEPSGYWAERWRQQQLDTFGESNTNTSRISRTVQHDSAQEFHWIALGTL